MVKFLLFAFISLPIIYVSRASLRAPRSHGFYRFFAWECILAIALLQIDVWFQDPFSWHQLVSWFLLIFSIVPLVFGVRTLIARGKPISQRVGEPQLLAFEKTSTLVTTGVYHYIRHPLYASLLFLTWGVFFKDPVILSGSLALVATLFLVLTARADEAECTSFFGPAYQDYMRHTKMFVPFVI